MIGPDVERIMSGRRDNNAKLNDLVEGSVIRGRYQGRGLERKKIGLDFLITEKMENKFK